MKFNRSVPTATVIPVLVYPDVRAAVSWLSAAFGFAERVRIGDNHRAQLQLGDGAVIIGDVHGDRRAPQPGEASASTRFHSGEPSVVARSTMITKVAHSNVPNKAKRQTNCSSRLIRTRRTNRRASTSKSRAPSTATGSVGIMAVNV